MHLTVIKGTLPDRVVVGFWVGGQMQSVVLSYTELEDVMSKEDIQILMNNPLGIWRADCNFKLRGTEWLKK